MKTEHDHNSFEHACPACGLAPRQIQPTHVFGFEPHNCAICGEVKGGNPYHYCRCQRIEKLSAGDYATLNDGQYCRVEKGWHGKDSAWLVVTYSKNKTPMQRSVERCDVKDSAPLPE